MKYRLYIDEVGNKDLASADNPNERFLCLTGVIFELGYVRTCLTPRLDELKRAFFIADPDEPMVFHRRALINGEHPFEPLKDPDIRIRFDNRVLETLSDLEFAIISVVIDKLEHRQRYTTWVFEPYHYCLAVLLERFMFFLKNLNSKAI